MTRPIIVTIAVVVVAGVGGAVYLAVQHAHQASQVASSQQTKPNATTPTPQAASSTSSQPSSSSSVSVSTKSTSTVNGQTTVAPTNISLTATDDSATQLSFGVAKGSVVTLTINVSSSGVYHNGLMFKSASPALDSGVIAPGATGTLHFTAANSFVLNPYWADGTPKGYSIAINIS